MNAITPAVQRQIELLAIRAAELADRAFSGQVAFIDAVDMAYSAAVWSGLGESIGDDQVQLILAAAFSGGPHDAS